MLKLILHIALVLSLGTLLNAQPTIDWEKTYGGSEDDNLYSIQVTVDGGIIMAGNSLSTDGDVSGNIGNRDFWIVKTDSLGNINWEKSLGSVNNDEAFSIKQTLDYGYIVAGRTRAATNSWDGYLVKLDSLGLVQYEIILGGIHNDEFYDVIQTHDGGYMVVGYTNIINSWNGDYWAIKFNDTLGVEWNQHYGGSDKDIARSVIQTPQGGYVIAGESSSNDLQVSSYQGSLSEYWLIRIDSFGNLQWSQTYGGTGFDIAYDLQATFDGGYILTGTTTSLGVDVLGNNGNGDFWVLKLDSTGAIEWQNCLGGVLYEESFAIKQAADSGFVAVGFANSNNADLDFNLGFTDVWITKLTKTGQLDWNKSIGGSKVERAFTLDLLVDGSILVGGYTSSSNYDVSVLQGQFDYWLVKLNSCPLDAQLDVQNDFLEVTKYPLETTFQWIDCTSGLVINNETNSSLYPDLEGYYQAILYKDGCSDTSACTYICPVSAEVSVNGNKITALESSPNTTFQWIDCLNNDKPILGATDQSFTAPRNGNFAVIVYQGNCVDTSYCIIISSVGIKDESIGNFSIYPNPSSRSIAISGIEGLIDVLIYDLNGRLVIHSDKNQIDIGKLDTGLYIVHVRTDQGNMLAKFVKD